MYYRYGALCLGLLLLGSCKVSKTSEKQGNSYSYEESSNILCHCEHVAQANYIYENQLGEYYSLATAYSATHFAPWPLAALIDSFIKPCKGIVGSRFNDSQFHTPRFFVKDRPLKILRIQNNQRTAIMDSLAKYKTSNEPLVKLSCTQCNLLIAEKDFHFKEFGLDSSFDQYIQNKYQVKGFANYTYADMAYFCKDAIKKGLGDNPKELLLALENVGKTAWDLTPTYYNLKHNVEKNEYWLPQSLGIDTLCNSPWQPNTNELNLFRLKTILSNSGVRTDSIPLNQLYRFFNSISGNINHSAVLNNMVMPYQYTLQFFNKPQFPFNANVLTTNNWYFQNEEFNRYFNHLQPEFIPDSIQLTSTFYHLEEFHPNYGLRCLVRNESSTIHDIALVFDSFSETNSLYDIISFTDFKASVLNNGTFTCAINQLVPTKFRNNAGVKPFLFMGRTLFYYCTSNATGYFYQ